MNCGVGPGRGSRGFDHGTFSDRANVCPVTLNAVMTGGGQWRCLCEAFQWAQRVLSLGRGGAWPVFVQERLPTLGCETLAVHVSSIGWLAGAAQSAGGRARGLSGATSVARPKKWGAICPPSDGLNDWLGSRSYTCRSRPTNVVVRRRRFHPGSRGQERTACTPHRRHFSPRRARSSCLLRRWH